MAWHTPLTKKYGAAAANKYGAIRTDLDGYSFASKGEAACYVMLKQLNMAGELADIRCQRTIKLMPSVNFKVDFVVYDMKLAQDVYVEFKGFQCERWRMIRNTWRDVGPGILRVYGKKNNGVFLVEEIHGGKRG